MTKRTYGHTKPGQPIDDDLIEKLVDEAEAGYDVGKVIPRAASVAVPHLAPRPQPSSLFALIPNSKSASRAEQNHLEAS